MQHIVFEIEALYCSAYERRVWSFSCL